MRLSLGIKLVVACIVILIVAWGAYVLAPRSLAKMVGTGGYVTEEVTIGPYPFRFESPRLWVVRSYTDVGLDTVYVHLGGPDHDAGTMLNFIDIVVRPVHSYSSLQEFRHAVLQPSKYIRDLSESKTSFRYGEALSITYTDTIYLAPPAAPLNSGPISLRGQAMVFENRGYYYGLVYVAAEAEYERYLPIFERLVSSFEFLE